MKYLGYTYSKKACIICQKLKYNEYAVVFIC